MAAQPVCLCVLYNFAFIHFVVGSSYLVKVGIASNFAWLDCQQF